MENNIFLERAKLEGFKELDNPLILTAHRFLSREKSVWVVLEEDSVWGNLKNDR